MASQNEKLGQVAMAEPGALEPAGVEVEDPSAAPSGDRETDQRGIDRAGADLRIRKA